MKRGVKEQTEDGVIATPGYWGANLFPVHQLWRLDHAGSGGADVWNQLDGDRCFPLRMQLKLTVNWQEYNTAPLGQVVPPEETEIMWAIVRNWADEAPYGATRDDITEYLHGGTGQSGMMPPVKATTKGQIVAWGIQGPNRKNFTSNRVAADITGEPPVILNHTELTWAAHSTEIDFDIEMSGTMLMPGPLVGGKKETTKGKYFLYGWHRLGAGINTYPWISNVNMKAIYTFSEEPPKRLWKAGRVAENRGEAEAPMKRRRGE